MTSSLWDYYEKVPGQTVAMCILCRKEYSYKTTTTNLKKHLSHKHVNDYHNLINSQQNRTTVTLVTLENRRASVVEQDEASDGSASEHNDYNESPPLTNDVLAPLTEATPLSKPKRRSNSNKRFKVEVADEYFVEEDNMLDKELQAIASNVACKLKRMDPLQRCHAELLINKVLLSGLKSNLSDETDLTDVYK